MKSRVEASVPAMHAAATVVRLCVLTPWYGTTSILLATLLNKKCPRVGSGAGTDVVLQLETKGVHHQRHARWEVAIASRVMLVADFVVVARVGLGGGCGGALARGNASVVGDSGLDRLLVLCCKAAQALGRWLCLFLGWGAVRRQYLGRSPLAGRIGLRIFRVSASVVEAPACVLKHIIFQVD